MPIGMAYLVGTNLLVLVSLASMQSLRKTSKVRTWKWHLKIWLKLGVVRIACELLDGSDLGGN